MNKIEQWMNSRIRSNFRSGLDRMEQAVSAQGGRIRPSDSSCDRANGKGSPNAFLRQC